MNYIIGKNKHDNVKIIQESTPNDIWFHLADYSSAHLIYHNQSSKNMNRLRKDGTIYRMASILKSHMKTKLRMSSDMHTTVIYAYIKDIKLISPVGTVKIIGEEHTMLI